MYISVNLLDRVLKRGGGKERNSKGENGRNCVSSEFVQVTCVCKFCTFPVK